MNECLWDGLQDMKSSLSFLVDSNGQTIGFYMCNIKFLPQETRMWLKVPSDWEQHIHTKGVHLEIKYEVILNFDLVQFSRILSLSVPEGAINPILLYIHGLTCGLDPPSSVHMFRDIWKMKF